MRHEVSPLPTFGQPSRHHTNTGGVVVYLYLYFVSCILSALTLFWVGALATVVKDKGRVSSLPLVALSCNTHKPIHSHQNRPQTKTSFSKKDYSSLCEVVRKNMWCAQYVLSWPLILSEINMSLLRSSFLCHKRQFGISDKIWDIDKL